MQNFEERKLTVQNFEHYRLQAKKLPETFKPWRKFPFADYVDICHSFEHARTYKTHNIELKYTFSNHPLDR